MHHDFDVLPNGNIAAIEWVKIPPEKMALIKGGREKTEFKGTDMFTDRIVEVDKDKNIVWSWSALDKLDLTEYEIPQMFPKEQWSHGNSIKYVPSDPFFGKEAYIVSMRYFNTVLLISKESGEVIWKFPAGLLGHQHDATVLKNGNILVFNNAFHTSVSQNYYSYGSGAIEIDPRTNKIVWEFSGGNNPLDKARLTEVIMSGAQRLPNGNTLITLGTTGHLLEVTPDKDVVWDFINPHTDPTSEAFPSNYIFKSRRYFADEIKWLEKFGNPMPELSSFCR